MDRQGTEAGKIEAGKTEAGKIKTGIIDVGGGLRGIYGAGVTDALMDMGIEFDTYIGVSAGAANMVSYIAGQRGRNYRFYTDYSFRREYMGWQNYIHDGAYINLDYIYGELSNRGGEDPLDYPAIANSGKELIIVATDADTGKPVYFTADDMSQDDYGPVKASSCVPVVNKPYKFHGKDYFDGGLSDSVPIDKAWELGCDKVVVILTKPRDYYRETDTDVRLSLLLEPKYPACAKALSIRGDLYNWSLDKAKEQEAQGKVLIVSPDDIGGMRTLSRKKDDMDMLYDKGLRDAKAIPEFLH